MLKEKEKKMREELGEKAPPPLPQITIDNSRVHDETYVDPNDEEIINDNNSDEISCYYNENRTPKILITTSLNSLRKVRPFANELVQIFPGAEFYPREKYGLKEIADYAISQNYTNVIFLNEGRTKCSHITLINLPDGPTCIFKISSLKLSKSIPNYGRTTSHFPEIILNGFSTRLGQRIGRIFGSLLPQKPDFTGRRVITFHNQRDYIFFRHHRYIFRNQEKVGLQEIGPQFTLKLWSVQVGIFGEYEWKRTTKMDVNRKKFYL